MNLHELLEVEEGELIRRLESQEFLEGLVCLEDTLVFLILKTLFLTIGVDALGDLSPSN